MKAEGSLEKCFLKNGKTLKLLRDKAQTKNILEIKFIAHYLQDTDKSLLTLVGKINYLCFHSVENQDSGQYSFLMLF